MHFTLADRLHVAQLEQMTPHTPLRTGSTPAVQRNVQLTSIWRHNFSVCALSAARHHSSIITPHHMTPPPLSSVYHRLLVPMMLQCTRSLLKTRAHLVRAPCTRTSPARGAAGHAKLQINLT